MKFNLNLFNIETADHTLYHRSNKVFDRPDESMIIDARSWSDTHHNSVIGLWASTYPEMCASFGKLNYKLTIKPGTTCLGITYEQWFKLGTKVLYTHQEFSDLRFNLLKDNVVDILYIIDATNRVNEVIVVNFDCIESCIDVGDVLDSEHKLKKLGLNRTYEIEYQET